MSSAIGRGPAGLPATFRTASRSVKMPTRRPPSTTSTQSEPFSCMTCTASSTSADTSRTSGSPTFSSCSSSSRCSPRSGPRYWVAGSGTSRPARSAPQLSQTSSPVRLSKPHAGQRIRILPLDRSADRPGLAAAERRREIALALGPDRGLDLAVDELIVGRAWDRPQDPDRDREVRPEHPRKHQRQVWLLRQLVVDEQVRLGHAVLADRDDLRVQAAEADAPVAVLAEDHRLAVLEDEHPVLAHLAVGEVAPGA